MTDVIMPRESAWSLMHEDEKLFLANTIKNLSSGSVVLEVGSWCMGSACIMAANNINVNIYCVDLYNDDKGSSYVEKSQDEWDDSDRFSVKKKIEALGGKARTLENCQNAVSHYPNITCIKNDTSKPLEHIGWDKTIDVYFEDGRHCDPWLHNNLNYFSSHLKVGGLLLVHDCMHYEDNRFKDVIDNVDRLLATDNYVLKNQIVSLSVLEKIK
jgi:hypothetical protein